MGRMADFFGAPNVPNNNRPNGQNGPLPNEIENINQRQDPLPDIIMNANPRPGPIPVVQQPLNQNDVDQNQRVILVNRNQNADEVVRNVQQNNFAGQNNLAHLVEIGRASC